MQPLWREIVPSCRAVPTKLICVKKPKLRLQLKRGLKTAMNTRTPSKVIEYEIAKDGLLPNLISFNLGVKLGQLLALSTILIIICWWRRWWFSAPKIWL